jgi:metalloendopeptidase OMA1, mitochondrial
VNETVLPSSHRDSQLVASIGARIVSALPRGANSGVQGYCEHLRKYKWEFVAIRSASVNAFVVPGGKVVVYTGAAPPPPHVAGPDP